MLERDDWPAIRREIELQEERIAKYRDVLTVAEPQASLRDQFAMAALTGYLAQGSHDCTPDEILHDCYLLADAGMKARKDTRTDTIIPKDILVGRRDGVDYPAVGEGIYNAIPRDTSSMRLGIYPSCGHPATLNSPHECPICNPRKPNFDTSIGSGCDECGNTHGDAHSSNCKRGA